MEISADVPLAPRTTLGVGGAAKRLVVANDDATVTAAVELARRDSEPLYVLGGGSNLVVSDSGVPGLVLAMATRGVRVEEAGTSALVTAAAGEPWDAFVADMVARGYAGLECLSGIPGLVGATPIQNVGAYGQEVAETIAKVRVLDREDGRSLTFLAPECRFAYRDSFFKSGLPDRFIVLEVSFRLVKGGAPSVRYAELEKAFAAKDLRHPSLAEARQTVIELRRQKSMVYDPSDENRRSCGSFFVNPIVAAAKADALAAENAGLPRYPQPDGRVKLSAAWLIERAGMVKGTRDGAVGISTRHSLALVAHDGARASDVLAFAERVRSAVRERFGITLVPEPVFWGSSRLAWD